MMRPAPIYLFNKNVLSTYAQRLVRKEAFLFFCSDKHKCVTDEDNLIARSEEEIAELIKKDGILKPNTALKEAYVVYVRRLIQVTIEMSDFEEDIREEVAARVATYNLMTPFEIANLAMAAGSSIWMN